MKPPLLKFKEGFYLFRVWFFRNHFFERIFVFFAIFVNNFKVAGPKISCGRFAKFCHAAKFTALRVFTILKANSVNLFFKNSLFLKTEFPAFLLSQDCVLNQHFVFLLSDISFGIDLCALLEFSAGKAFFVNVNNSTFLLYQSFFDVKTKLNSAL